MKQAQIWHRRTSLGRTPLFGSLRRALNLAAIAERPGAPSLDALFEKAEAGRLSRRQFLGRASLAMGAVATTLALPDIAWARRKSAPGARVAVVGAGIAGLVAAWRLAAAGHDVSLYEANRRIGGRIISDRGTLGPGLTVELGGSFINGDHDDMLGLVRELGLTLEDGKAEAGPKLVDETYFFGGRHYTTRDIADALRPFAARIEADRRASEEGPGALALDRLSVAAYMDRLGMTGWLRDLYTVGYTQEMGGEVDAQSALYLVTTLVADPTTSDVGLFSSDQRYQIKGGNDQLPAAIAARLGDRIRLGHRLEAVRPRGSGYALTFARDGGSVDAAADLVVLALPFTTLRACELALPLSPVQRRAIAELRYGSNAKVIAGVARRPWRDHGFGGNIISDAGFQAAWEDHRDLAQPGGTVTFFAGGRDGLGIRSGPPDGRARGFLAALGSAYPGVAAAYTGRATRMHWPSNPHVRGSYCCFAPGQWVPFTDAFPNPVGRVLFAGEQCSGRFSGYMNGGAETGRLAAEAAIASLGSVRPAPA